MALMIPRANLPMAIMILNSGEIKCWEAEFGNN